MKNRLFIINLFLLKCLYYVSYNPVDFLCLVTVYGYDYLYLYFMVSTRTRNSRKGSSLSGSAFPCELQERKGHHQGSVQSHPHRRLTRQNSRQGLGLG